MITIVGAGALGSHVALFLRNVDPPIKLVDFDKVEMKNTHAQFHTRMGLRKNKGQALAQAFLAMFGRRLEVVPHKVTKDNVAGILRPQNTDLVLDCTDNAKARYLLVDHCTDFAIPCLHGCLSADGTFARIIWSELFVPDAEGEEGEATCEGGEHLPFFAFVAGLMAWEAQSFLSTSKRGNYHVAGSEVLKI
jgi:molybdopterin/thiamine biosynthesis adenylyltransferase